MKVTVTYNDSVSQRYVVDKEMIEVFLRGQGILDHREDLEIILQERITPDWGDDDPATTAALFISPSTIGLFTWHRQVNHGLLRALHHYIHDFDYDLLEEITSGVQEEDRPSIKDAEAFACHWEQRITLIKEKP